MWPSTGADINYASVSYIQAMHKPNHIVGTIETVHGREVFVAWRPEALHTRCLGWPGRAKAPDE